jgi:small subunit ribosomal protein S2
MQDITIKDLLAAGIHFGHRRSYWHPSMKPYIYCERDGLHIIDLRKTLAHFQSVLKYIHSLSQKGGKILFVGTKPTARDTIKQQAQRCGMPYVDHRWLGGMLTNYKTIRQSIKRLRDLERMIENNEFEGLTKKERLTLMREQEKLEQTLGGIKDMGSLPDALFVIDTGYERIAIEEAKRLSIPVIGVVDSNHDPHKVNYVVPGNDDAFRAVEFYVKTAADTILEAREEVAESMAGDAEESEQDQESKRRRVVTKKLSLKRGLSKQDASEEQQADEHKTSKDAETATDSDQPQAQPESEASASANAQTQLEQAATVKVEQEQTEQQSVGESPANEASTEEKHSAASDGSASSSSTKSNSTKSSSQNVTDKGSLKDSKQQSWDRPDDDGQDSATGPKGDDNSQS